MTHYQITYSAVVGTTLSLRSILTFHDLSEEMWNPLQDCDHTELIETYPENSGLGEGAKLRSMKEISLGPRTPEDCPSVIKPHSTTVDLLASRSIFIR